MAQSVSYVGIYKDAFGVTEIIMHNDFKKFSLKIDGVEFEGSEFNALEIVNKQSYSVKQLERFTLCQTKIYSTNDFVEEICNCTFNIVIPQLIVCSKTQEVFIANFRIHYVLGDKKSNSLGGGIEYEKIYFSLKVFADIFKRR